MPTPLNAIDLSTAIVGSTGKIDLSSCAPTSHPMFTGKYSTLVLYNESGAGLRLAGKDTGLAADLPAGAWLPLPVPVAETLITYTAQYILSNAPVNTLLATYYPPNESAVGAVLGNSPIGLSGNVPLNATATAVQNDGNALTTFVEATLTGHASSDVRIKNNGSAGFNNSVEAINYVSFQNGVSKLVGLFGYDGTNNNLSITLNTDGSFTGQFGIPQGGFGRFTGAASGTYNHGYGATPSWFGPMQSVIGSQTMGYDTVTSTQVHITSGSANSFSCLCTKL